MTGIAELASSMRGSAAGVRREVMVRDLKVGMTIALPFREFHLPWLVLAEPVPVTPDHDDGLAPADPPEPRSRDADVHQVLPDSPRRSPASPLRGVLELRWAEPMCR